MQMTRYPSRARNAVTEPLKTRFLAMPQAPGTMFKFFGRDYYVDLNQTARRVPESLVRFVKRARKARAIGRFLGKAFSIVVGTALALAVVLAFAYVVDRYIIGR